MSTEWKDQTEPELIDNADQVLDPMTAYQITSMMEGVVQRGTATTLLELNRPIAGKTGTTNDEKDAWFIGFTPNLVVGLYVGFDQPQTLGKGTTGGGLAAPIFKEFMAEALKDTPPVDFQVPEGMNLIAINRKTGMRANEGEPGTIMEAFKPGTGPADTYWVIGMDAGGEMGEALSPAASRRHPDRRRRALLNATDDFSSGSRMGGRRRLAHCALHASAASLCSAPIQPAPSHMESPIQPCARKPKNSSTKSSRRISLLRRHL